MTTEKKKPNFKGALEVFAKSIVQPMMYLSVAGILLIVGIILTNKTICTMIPVLGSGPFQLVGAVVYQSLMFIINNLSIIFCVGIAGAMAKKNKGHASLIALMSFFLFLEANNIVLSATGSLAEAGGMLGLVGTGQTTVMGIQVLDTGVFGGIILGCITGAIFNKFSNKQFPIALSMFSGVRFPFLIMILISWVMGAGFCIVWPPVQGAISSLAGVIKESGNIGLFIYGMLNKLLVPTGLHHLVYTPFQFSDVGGTLAMGDQIIAGAYPIRVAEMAMTGQPFSDSTYFNSYTFNNLWPYIGIGLAFITTAYKENKEKTKAVIIPLIITAVLSCVTEPMDFLFVFSAPVLFVIHSVLSGVFVVLLKVLSVPASTAGGIINIVVSNLVLGVEKTNWPVMLVLGVIDAALYFFLFTVLIKKLNLHTPGREEASELAESVAEGEAAASVAVKQGAVSAAPAEGVDAGIADLVAGLGGKDSKLVHDLAKLGVSADDIAVVSKHDTSTNANDPNESELHNTLAHAIGRTDGNPLFVISQKSLTGHAKGGACIFQVNGLTQLFKSGVVPANAALDCVDPKLKRDDHMVWLREPLKVGSVKAGLATSLGFGHVSGFAAIVNPGAFEASVANTAGEDALNEWRDRANARLAAGQRRLEEGMMGRAALYEPIDNRRFHEDGRGYDAHEVEKAMLLDPNARLASTGYFEA